MKWGRPYLVLSELIMLLWGREVIPDIYLRSVFEFDPGRSPGIEGILFDWEGTLAMFEETEVLPGIYEYLRGLNAQGYKMAVLTNKGYESEDYAGFVKEVEANSGIKMVRNGGFLKPNPRVFYEGMAALKIQQPSKIAMVGDSLMTDIYGAIRANIGLIVWVDPAPGKEPWYMKWFARPLDAMYKYIVGIKHTKL